MNCIPRFLRSGRSDWTFLFAGAGRISILSGQLGQLGSMSETSRFHPGNAGLLESVRQPRADLWMAEAHTRRRDTESLLYVALNSEGGSLHGQHLHEVAGAL